MFPKFYLKNIERFYYKSDLQKGAFKIINEKHFNFFLFGFYKNSNVNNS